MYFTLRASNKNKNEVDRKNQKNFFFLHASFLFDPLQLFGTQKNETTNPLPVCFLLSVEEEARFQDKSNKNPGKLFLDNIQDIGGMLACEARNDITTILASSKTIRNPYVW